MIERPIHIYVTTDGNKFDTLTLYPNLTLHNLNEGSSIIRNEISTGAILQRTITSEAKMQIDNYLSTTMTTIEKEIMKSCSLPENTLSDYGKNLED